MLVNINVIHKKKKINILFNCFKLQKKYTMKKIILGFIQLRNIMTNVKIDNIEENKLTDLKLHFVDFKFTVEESKFDLNMI